MADQPKCPICKRAAQQGHKPFCSKRCADVDLGRWLGGAYGIPAEEDEDEPEAPPPEDGDRRH